MGTGVKLIAVIVPALLCQIHAVFLPEAMVQHPSLRESINPPTELFMNQRQESPKIDSNSRQDTSTGVSSNRQDAQAVDPSTNEQAPKQSPDLPAPVETSLKTDAAAETTTVNKSPVPEEAHPSQTGVEIIQAVGETDQIDASILPQASSTGTVKAAADEKPKGGDKPSFSFMNEFETPNVLAVKQETVTEAGSSSSKSIEATAKAAAPTTELPTFTPEEQLSFEKLIDLLISPVFMSKPKPEKEFLQLPRPETTRPKNKIKLKCEGVRCTPPNFPGVCSISKTKISIPANSAFAHLSKCCPIWFCTNSDGTVYTHYGLTRSPQGRGNLAGRSKPSKPSHFQSMESPLDTLSLEPYAFDVPPIMNKLARQAQPGLRGDLQQEFSRPKSQKDVRSLTQSQQPYKLSNINRKEQQREIIPQVELLTSQSFETVFQFDRPVPFPDAKASSRQSGSSRYPGNRAVNNGRQNVDKNGLMSKPGQMPLFFELPFANNDVEPSADQSFRPVMVDYPEERLPQRLIQKPKQKFPKERNPFQGQSQRGQMQIQNMFNEGHTSDLRKNPFVPLTRFTDQSRTLAKAPMKRKESSSSEESPLLFFMSYNLPDPLPEGRSSSKQNQRRERSFDSSWNGKAFESSENDFLPRERKARFAPFSEPMPPFFF